MHHYDTNSKGSNRQIAMQVDADIDASPSETEMIMLTSQLFT